MVNVLDSFFTNNFSTTFGGAICNNTNLVDNCILYDNRARKWGGGIYGGFVYDSLIDGFRNRDSNIPNAEVGGGVSNVGYYASIWFIS